jgi:hypothetical protein
VYEAYAQNYTAQSVSTDKSLQICFVYHSLRICAPMTRLVKVTHEVREESVCAEARGTGYLEGRPWSVSLSGASGEFRGTIWLSNGRISLREPGDVFDGADGRDHRNGADQSAGTLICRLAIRRSIAWGRIRTGRKASRSSGLALMRLRRLRTARIRRSA